MPQIIVALLEGLAVIGRAIWPFIVKAGAFLGIQQLTGLLFDWIGRFLGAYTIQTIVANLMVAALMIAWGIFLGVFFTYASGTGLREIFSLNPFTGAPAAMLYLASYAFPFKFFFGTAFAYIVWRFTFIQAAIVMNRLVKVMVGV